MDANIYALKARIAALEAGIALAEMEIKGGAGSGNWGHAGRPGQKGGSSSRSVAMSRTSGRDAAARQAAAKGKNGKSKTPNTVDGSVSIVEDERLTITNLGRNTSYALKKLAAGTGKTSGDMTKEAKIVVDELEKAGYGTYNSDTKTFALTDKGKAVGQAINRLQKLSDELDSYLKDRSTVAWQGDGLKLNGYRQYISFLTAGLGTNSSNKLIGQTEKFKTDLKSVKKLLNSTDEDYKEYIEINYTQAGIKQPKKFKPFSEYVTASQ